MTYNSLIAISAFECILENGDVVSLAWKALLSFAKTCNKNQQTASVHTKTPKTTLLSENIERMEVSCYCKWTGEFIPVESGGHNPWKVLLRGI